MKTPIWWKLFAALGFACYVLAALQCFGSRFEDTNRLYFSQGEECLTNGEFVWVQREFPYYSYYSNTTTGAIVEPSDFEFGNGHWDCETNMGPNVWCIIYTCASVKPAETYWLRAYGNSDPVSHYGVEHSNGLLVSNLSRTVGWDDYYKHYYRNGNPFVPVIIVALFFAGMALGWAIRTRKI